MVNQISNNASLLREGPGPHDNVSSRDSSTIKPGLESESAAETLKNAAERLEDVKRLAGMRDDTSSVGRAPQQEEADTLVQETNRKIPELAVIDLAAEATRAIDGTLTLMRDLVSETARPDIESSVRLEKNSEYVKLQEGIVKIAGEVRSAFSQLIANRQPPAKEVQQETTDAEQSVELWQSIESTLGDLANGRLGQESLTSIDDALAQLEDVKIQVENYSHELGSEIDSLRRRHEQIAGTSVQIQDAAHARGLGEQLGLQITEHGHSAIRSQANIASQVALALLQ